MSTNPTILPWNEIKVPRGSEFDPTNHETTPVSYSEALFGNGPSSNSWNDQRSSLAKSSEKGREGLDEFFEGTDRLSEIFKAVHDQYEQGHIIMTGQAAPPSTGFQKFMTASSNFKTEFAKLNNEAVDLPGAFESGSDIVESVKDAMNTMQSLFLDVRRIVDQWKLQLKYHENEIQLVDELPSVTGETGTAGTAGETGTAGTAGETGTATGTAGETDTK